MRIGIDVSMIDSNKAGIGYYAYSLVAALVQIDSKNEYFLFTHNAQLLNDLKLTDKFKVVEVTGNGNLKWMIRCLKEIRKLGLDEFLSPSNLFWGCVLPNCTTVIHDIAQIVHPEFFFKKGNLFYKLELSLLLRRSGRVITPSNAVKQEILKHYRFIRSKVSVITEGLHGWAKSSYTEEDKLKVLNKYNLPEKYLLSVGTLEPRKNLPKVFEGFSEFVKTHPEYKLVIVGKKGWFYDQIFESVKTNLVENSVIFFGYVPESDLAVIYDNCEFVISLSFYEGFGLPLIEANARNKAVLASNIEVYRELNIEGEYVDLNANSLEVAEKMEKLLNYTFKPNHEFFDIYSWKNVAEHFLNLWHE